MAIEYSICDVFTDRPFGGNPLAVIHDARGLSSEQMQRIAREFNFSETSFVLPAERGGTRRVRIFTPSREVPFAGHPNIGTACVLSTLGIIGTAGRPLTACFEELAGDVPIEVELDDATGLHRARLQAPERLSIGTDVAAADVAHALGLDVADIDVSVHEPLVASVGLPFLFVRLKSYDCLQRVKPNQAAFDLLATFLEYPFIHAYVLSSDSVDVRSRMFAPTDGVPEDPATGSANCALAALLAHLDGRSDGSYHWRIAQGVEMGRPSLLLADAQKQQGEVVACGVAGTSVIISRGELFL